MFSGKQLILAGFFCAGMAFGQTTDVITWVDPWKYHQEGVLPAEDWMQPEYDDSGWPSGNGVLGFPYNENLLIGGAGVNTLLASNNAAGSNILTYYFRRTFALATTNNVSLTASNLFDDGAVVYVNGREVARPGMPAGAVSYATLADPRNEISLRGADVYSIPLSFVSVGTNVIAVEVHQNTTNSSDVIMGMRLVAGSIGSAPSISNHPRDTTVDAGNAATFTVEVTGTNPRYQWFTNNVAVFNATNSTLIIPNTTPAMSGRIIHVVVTNVLGSVRSSNAVLTVVSDVKGPRLVAAIQTRTNTFDVRFNEQVTLTSSTNVANYKVHILGTANTMVVTQAQHGGNFIRVRFNRNVDPNANYVVCIYNIADVHGNLTSGDCIGVTLLAATNQAITLGDEWRLSHDPPLGDEWTFPEFDDSGWFTGTGLFWNGTNAPTTCSTAGSQIPKTRTQYYRNTFVAASTTATNVTLTVQFAVDDGAVFYLNGFEVARHNMSPGAVNYETPPSATVVGPPVCVTITTNVSSSWLLAGTNVFAAEVHQAETGLERTETDLAFDASLSISYQETPTIPALTITRPDATTVTVSWVGDGWQLERAGAPDGEWETVSGVQTLQGTNTFSDTVAGMRFYRLKNPQGAGSHLI